jgi:hypothetical protein
MRGTTMTVEQEFLQDAYDNVNAALDVFTHEMILNHESIYRLLMEVQSKLCETVSSFDVKE